MRSSGVLAFRAMVMLLTLVAVPSIALFWKSVPTTVDKLLAVCEERLGFKIPRALQQSRGNADSLGLPGLSDAPRFAPSPESPFAAPTDSFGSEPRSDRPKSVPPANDAPHYPAVQASFETPVAGRGTGPIVGEMQTAPPSGNSPVPLQDRFTSIQLRLRELGATYYLLESWGAEGNRFRFHCRMAMAGNDRYFRQFETVADDPMAAMAEVLRQVEDWRSGRTR